MSLTVERSFNMGLCLPNFTRRHHYTLEKALEIQGMKVHSQEMSLVFYLTVYQRCTVYNPNLPLIGTSHQTEICSVPEEENYSILKEK